MRLWHYELIPVLPDKMLVSQWRECIAIKRQWEKGTLKHRLVAYVKDHPRYCFLNYVFDVCDEMAWREINYQKKYFNEINQFCDENYIDLFAHYPEHNTRYLKQCLYNLQEKFDRGIISFEEWQKIVTTL